jgi:hypothetical protein
MVPAEGDTMSKIEYLREQAARAERLAKTVMDALTAQRLQAFAAECRREIKTQAERAAAGNRLPSSSEGECRGW